MIENHNLFLKYCTNVVVNFSSKSKNMNQLIGRKKEPANS